jgi:hypothetical protein
MNVRVNFESVNCGLVCAISTTATEETVTQFAKPVRKMFGDYAFSSVREKGINFGKSANCVPHELADLELYHSVRYAKLAADPTASQMRLIHVWSAIASWLKSRDVQFGHVPQILGVGWWRRDIGSTPILAELASLLGCLDRARASDVTSIESAFAEVDNGKCVYAD